MRSRQLARLGAAAAGLLLAACRTPPGTSRGASTPAPIAAAAAVSVDTAAAIRALAEFDRECRRVATRSWPASLCGPVVLVDPESRLATANAPDPDGRFARVDGAFVGTVAPDEPLANTAIDWRGSRWTMVMLPLPADTFNRLRLLGHESFHRIQPAIGVPLLTPLNAHLEERDARLWLRLELRALARAVTAPHPDSARLAAADALRFRAARQALHPGADTLEAQLETGEGLAEYAGVRFAMDALGRPAGAALEWSRARFERTPTFVRSLGYGTGPALGLALDRFAPGWRERVGAMRSPGAALAECLRWTPPTDPVAAALERARAYDFERLAAEEDVRAAERAARVAGYRARLIDGPVVVFAQRWLAGPYDPNTVVPLGDAGTVYPRRTFTAEWGTLRVSEGGALVSADHRLLRVAAPDSLPTPEGRTLTGPGWELRLADGWTLERGPRAADWRAVRR